MHPTFHVFKFMDISMTFYAVMSRNGEVSVPTDETTERKVNIWNIVHNFAYQS